MKRLRAACLLASLWLGTTAATADLYSCVSPQGQRISRDRPIDECVDVEQTVRRADGRVERIAPALSPDEVARREVEKERAEVERQKRIKEDRADRSLVSRFPNEAAHMTARNEALAGADTAIRMSRNGSPPSRPSASGSPTSPSSTLAAGRCRPS